jgi:hypothetical protein
METGAPIQEENHGVFIPPQQFMGQQERYAEEAQEHAAHLRDIQLRKDAEMQISYDREALEHQAHLDELRRQREQEREREVLEHEAHLAEI